MISRSYCYAILLFQCINTLCSKPPNIIFLLMDDVGSADINYNSIIKDIQTPNIDYLAKSGVRLTNYYVNSLCTPTRASFMTGRYPANVGLTTILVQGNPGGLPPEIPTISEVLLSNGYNTAMVGKWHLGHAQRKMTPAYRGFEKFVGIYMWDADSFTKQLYAAPWDDPLMIDWTREFNNGTYYHFAEPQHSTLAITLESEQIMLDHKNSGSDKPLFLYVAYTAAHSPLQPVPEHLFKCSDITHKWRRLFCGMVIGIDESVRNITLSAYENLGENTIIVISSDNGGSSWFGGLNYPYRGAKATPFEGGIKVPGVIVELSNLIQINSNDKNLSKNLNYFFNPKISNRTCDSLFHVTDWLPTLASISNISSSTLPNELDGYDLSGSLLLNIANNFNSNIKRKEMLVDYFVSEENVFQTSHLFAYRINDMKYIQGIIRDNHWYYPSQDDSINSTAKTMLSDISLIDLITDFKLNAILILNKLLYYYITLLGENLIKFLSKYYNEGELDTIQVLISHTIIQKAYSYLLPIDELLLPYDSYHRNLKKSRYNYKHNGTIDIHHIYLFNLTSDPYEQINLVDKYPNLVGIFQSKFKNIKLSAMTQQKLSYQLPIKTVWNKTHLPGDCSTNPLIKPSDCKFTHPWIPDDVDPWKFSEDKLIDSLEIVNIRLKQLAILLIVIIFITIISFCYVFWKIFMLSYKYLIK